MKKWVKWIVMAICVAAASVSLFDRFGPEKETEDTTTETAQVTVVENV